MLPSSRPLRLALSFTRPAGLHRAVQYGFLLFFLFVGMRFYSYAQWAMGESVEYVTKPASVEAFLPISALLGAKRLFFTGQYDFAHPAGLTILLMAFAVSLLFRKAFCGYLCPVGCVSTLLERLGKRLGISRRPGKWLSAFLTVPKYFLLLFFVYIVLWNMNIDDIEGFIRTPYNMVADTKMMLFFLNPGSVVLVSVGVLVIGSMLFPAFWCRGFCPYGALLGLFSWLSPVAVRREASKCSGCRRCTRVCPSRIVVHEKIRISGPECVGCVECVGVCPEKDCLDVRLGYTAKSPVLPFWSIAAGTMLTVYLFFTWAVLTGNWNSSTPPEMVRMYHKNILQMQHP